MKILLVEDDEDKRARVAACIKTCLPDASLVEARSMHGAVGKLKTTPFDLVVLDMTMPTFDISAEEDGGRPQAFAGLEIFRHIKRLEMTMPVIVVTQFDRFGVKAETRTLGQLDQELRDEFGAQFKGTVFFSVTYDEWQQQLTTRLMEATSQ